MNTTAWKMTLATALLAAAACGDNAPKGNECGEGTMNEDGVCVASGNECGEGTFDDNGTCVAIDPNDDEAPTTTASPAGGRSRDAIPGNVVLSSSEPATIYFTRDGSDPTTSSDSGVSSVTVTDIVEGETIKFFAVDAAGNEESIKSEIYDQDIEGPAVVGAFDASLSGNTSTLTWTNPTDDDFEGVVVVKSNAGALASAPVDGTALSVGDTLAGGEEVIFVGTAETTTDDVTALAVEAQEIYAAWAFDDLHNYSRRAGDLVKKPLAAQAGVLSINLVTDEVTVTTDPADLTLGATANYDEGTDVLTVSLAITNDSPKVLPNLKAVTGTLGQGTHTNGLPFDGGTMTYYGLGALDVNATTASQNIVISGVDGSVDPLTIDLDFVTHGVLANSTLYRDASLQVATVIDPNTFGTETRGMIASPDGRFLIAGDKDDGFLRVHDLVTNSNVSGADLAAGSSSIGGVALGLDGRSVLAAVNTNTHYNGGNGSDFGLGAGLIEIHRVDMTTLESTDTLTIPYDQAGMSARNLLVNQTTGVAVVPVSLNCNLDGEPTCAESGTTHKNELWLIDLGRFEVIDTDPTTEAIDPIALSVDEGVLSDGTFTPDGSTFFVGYNNINIGRDEGIGNLAVPIDVVDMSTFDVTRITPTDNGLASGGMMATNTTLYYGTRTKNATAVTHHLYAFDLTNGNAESFLDTGFAGTTGTASMTPVGDGLHFFVCERNNNGAVPDDMAMFKFSDNTRVDLDDNAGNGVTNVAADCRAHGLVASPN